MSGKRRVAITGIGVVSPVGLTYESFISSLFEGLYAVVIMEEWQRSPRGLSTRLAAPVQNFDGQAIPRVFRRSMSRVSLLAVEATTQAIRHAGLAAEDLQNERTGIAYGSTMGGTSTLEDYCTSYLKTNDFSSAANSTTFLKIMPHTSAANLAITFSIP
ncbi:MAG: beta-ketoacyl-[acyl-carrier-protein] synthase family protein, partial [Oligoflexales bacterium]|nr:beta-ketoacyl-[acyl-carrier-protein] synthase family protein [Oligoflexales bacterium]